MGKKLKPGPRRQWWQQKQRRQKCKESQRQHRQKWKESQRKESESSREELPIDVLHEILIRFPVKALCKFRCICKQWCALISHPSFQQDHFRRSQQNSLLLITRCEFNNLENSQTNTLHLSTYNKEGTLVNNFSKTGLQQCLYYPIQSCLGLVCLGARYDENPILICNPATQELIASPPVFGKHDCIGFGYAAYSKEFKVVRFFIHPNEDKAGQLVHPDEDEDPEAGQLVHPVEEVCCEVFVHPVEEVCCEVFVLGTNKWRAARTRPPQHLTTFFMWGAPFLHGALHLVHSLHHHTEHPCIDVFDIETEEYTKIPFPEYYYTLKESRFGLVHFKGAERIYLKELRGSLFLIFECRARLQFWCLKDYHNREWVKDYFIDLNSLGLGANVWSDPLQIMGDGSMMLNTITKGVMSLWYYNFENKSFSEVRNDNCSGTLYTESFLPLPATLINLQDELLLVNS